MSLRNNYEHMTSEEAMLRGEHDLRSSTSHYSRVLFDPIFTPLFTALFTSIGFSATAAAIGGSIATAIVTTAVSIGLQMLLAPKPPKAEDGKSPLTQPIPYRIFAVGRTRLAGARMLWEAVGSNLFSVNAIAGHRIKSFNRYWFHDDEITLNTGSVVGGMAAVNGLANGRYAKGGSRIATRIGLPTETPYALLVTSLGGSGIWTNDHRGDGQASVGIISQNTNEENQQQTYPYGIPNLSVEIDGAYCWDFRDPDQDPDDQSTWAWTRNCALILAWHLCFNEFGFGLDYHKALLPVIDLWQEEAEICDEDVPLDGGGVENRYECNGWDTAENGPKSALNAILAACDGHLVARGDGARVLTVGKFRESRCATLTDADLIGHQIQYDVLFEDEVNRLVPKFTYPATDYTTTDTDFFEDTTAQLDAGRVLSEEANYQWVHRWRQARRLGKRDWKRLRQKVRGSLDVRLSGLNAIYSRWVRLEAPVRLPRLSGKVVENRHAVLALTKGGYSMDIIQNPDDIDDWNPATDEGLQPPVPPAAGSSGIVTPVINLVQASANGGSVYIRVIIIDPEDGSLTPVVRYRVADIGAGVAGAWVEQPFPGAVPSGGYINLNTNTVPVNQLLEIEAAFKGTNKFYSEWSPTEDVISTADPTPPGSVTGISVDVSVPGEATFHWTAPNSSNYAGAKIYWNTVNTFGTASYLGPPEYGAPSTSDSATRTISAGNRYGWIVSINGSGVEGSPVATGLFVVT